MNNLNNASQSLLLEYQRRKLIRRNLLEWGLASGVLPTAPAKHHRFVVEKLEAAVRGDIKKLMISLPPGSAKSTWASVLFPVWYLAQGRDKIILSCSHNSELAAEFGRKCRNLVDGHALELGYQLSKDSKAADKWATNHNCEYRSAGVCTGIAGRRADLGLIDDPVGKKEDADSKLERDKLWNWWEFDFVPRLKPNATVILIMTRWHEDDLAGRLIAKEGRVENGGQWTVINIPLIAEDNDPLGRSPGEPLWKEWFTPEQIKNAQVSSAFTSLYQGRPAPEDGDFFKKEWFEPFYYKSISELPADLTYYVGSDHALTKKEENDRNCLIPFGVDGKGDVWILPDIFWKRCDTGELVDAMFEMVRRRRPANWWAESEHIEKAIRPFLNMRMQEERLFFVVTPLTSSRDLRTRAGAIQGMCKCGKVHFPVFATWWQEALHELLSFPVGTHDDFIAALSEIGRGLEGMVRPSRREEEPNGPLDKQAPGLTLRRLKELASMVPQKDKYDGR